MKVKYSGTPFHHFKCGIIMPGIIELEDEWARRLIEAGIVEPVEQAASPVQEDPANLSACGAQAGELPGYTEAENVGDPIAVYIENERQLHEDYITDPRRNDTGDEPRKRKRGK